MLEADEPAEPEADEAVEPEAEPEADEDAADEDELVAAAMLKELLVA